MIDEIHISSNSKLNVKIIQNSNQYNIYKKFKKLLNYGINRYVLIWLLQYM